MPHHTENCPFSIHYSYGASYSHGALGCLLTLCTIILHSASNNGFDPPTHSHTHSVTRIQLGNAGLAGLPAAQDPRAKNSLATWTTRPNYIGSEGHLDVWQRPITTLTLSISGHYQFFSPWILHMYVYSCNVWWPIDQPVKPVLVASKYNIIATSADKITLPPLPPRWLTCNMYWSSMQAQIQSWKDHWKSVSRPPCNPLRHKNTIMTEINFERERESVKARERGRGRGGGKWRDTQKREGEIRWITKCGVIQEGYWLWFKSYENVNSQVNVLYR